MRAPSSPRWSDVVVTMLAPAVWGSTYLVATETLPAGHPIMFATLRALPAGLILLALTRRRPAGHWLWRSVVLGSLNFSVFWVMLYIAAHRLPGGVAATLGAVQPLLVLGLSRLVLKAPVSAAATAAALAGCGGVALMLLGPDAALDPIGVAAGLAGAASMAAGTVLSRRWRAPGPVLSFTAWQLIAGGLVLLPLALWLEPPLPALSAMSYGGLAWLSLIGAAATYGLWFRGIGRLEPGAVSMLGLASPVTAVVLGWLWLGQGLSVVQVVGMAIVVISVLAGQFVHPTARRGGMAAA